MLDPRTFVRSVTRGRARIRHESLRGLSSEEAENLTAMIRGFEGITDAQLNPRVGSLLVIWDEEKTNADALLSAAAFFLPQETEQAQEAPEGGENQAESICNCALTEIAQNAGALVKKGAQKTLDLLAPVVASDVKSGGRTRRVTQNRLMLAGFAASLATLAVRNTALHTALGVAFTALLGVHLYQHRRVL